MRKFSLLSLISLGLVAIPFVFKAGYDTRIPKMGVTIFIAVALSLLAVSCYGVQSKNKWLTFFILYLPLNILLAPKAEIKLFGTDVSSFWVWQPFLVAVIFYLLIVSVSSIPFNMKDVSVLFTVMTWVGVVMSLYCVFQYFNIDPFFKRTAENATQARIGGTMGHPTIVSSFIAMIVPLSFYARKYWHSALMAVAVCLTASQMAIGALLCAMAFYFACKGRAWFVSIVCVGVISAVILIGGYFVSPKVDKFVEDNGRFQHWGTILGDVFGEKDDNSLRRVPVFGYGIGSFFHTYHVKHQNTYFQAHNEYLQLIYDTGLVGVLLFLAIILSFFKTLNIQSVWRGTESRLKVALLSSLVCICLCALGTFVWQLASQMFYSAVIVGLLINLGGFCDEEICCSSDSLLF